MDFPHHIQTLLFSILICCCASVILDYEHDDGNTTNVTVMRTLELVREYMRSFYDNEGSGFNHETNETFMNWPKRVSFSMELTEHAFESRVLQVSITRKLINLTNNENTIVVSLKNITVYRVDNISSVQLTGVVTTVLIPALYTLVFGIGLPANALGLWIMITKVKKLPSTIFLINLAIADLLLILMLPFKISYHLMGNDWLFGEALCRLYTGLFYGNMYGSILLLTLISVDRYFALVHPFLSRRFRSKSLVCGVCLGTWALVSVSLLPFLLEKQTYQIQNLNITTCHDALPVEQQNSYFFYYFASLVAVEFALPCAITLFCYGSVIKTLAFNEKKYKRAAGATTLTLLVYLLCFTPSNAILLIHQLEVFFTLHSDLYIYYMLSLALSGFSSCLDPFIYCFVSNDLRARVQEVFSCRKEKGSRGKSGELLRMLDPINTTPPTTTSSSISTSPSKIML